MSKLPLSLYIHFPWCVRKCPYCDFNSHTLHDTLPEQEYIDTLLQDLQQDIAAFNPSKIIHSIFIGGGTPSLFSAKSLGYLFDKLHGILSCQSNIEITLEANPGTVEQQRFKEFCAVGINRLSLGIQSFNEKHLKSLGRIHDSQQAKLAVIAAQKAGFTELNLDLMHGLPQQTLTEAIEDLNVAIALQPTHLSWYQLTLEPNTLFYKQPPVLPNDDTLAEIFQHGRDLLQQNGFLQYEVSAYSLNGHQCQHNLNYWRFGDYLGIGAGAHGKITDQNNFNVQRYWKIKHPKDYLAAKNFIGNKQLVTTKDLPFEFMLNALRLKETLPTALFTERTGLNFDAIAPVLTSASNKGLLIWDEQAITVTQLGERFLNDLIEMFLD